MTILGGDPGEQSDAGNPASDPLKILVVDDEPAMVGALGAVLGQAGHRIIAAYDGEEALRRFREDGPDLLTFVEAGGLARAGLNAAGIAVTANYLESDRDYRELGVPLALLRRRFLESEHLAMAMHAAARSGPTT